MTNYPGQEPHSNDPTGQQPEGDAPGYWEQHQAAQQGQPPASGAVFNPTSAYGAPDQQGEPYTQPYGQQPAGQPTEQGLPPYQAYPQQPAGQYGQPQYGQQYGQYPAQFPNAGYAYPAPAPNHPQATTAMVLGLVGLIGGLTLCLPALTAPFAWVFGRKALREIRASQGRLSGEGQAKAGMIMGIIGTVLMILAVLAIVGIVVAAFNSGSSSGTTTY